ncbi:hypothetical protein [Enterococcus sp. AZ007]|uniref:hypothetical protein n=1 Tax=Enterococcus sp. AZ007 TaxID=2774839 RepID=UPI003F2806C5
MTRYEILKGKLHELVLAGVINEDLEQAFIQEAEENGTDKDQSVDEQMKAAFLKDVPKKESK